MGVKKRSIGFFGELMKGPNSLAATVHFRLSAPNFRHKENSY